MLRVRSAMNNQDRIVPRIHRYLLLTRAENLDPDQLPKLERALQLNEPLSQGWYLKEELSLLWEERGKQHQAFGLADLFGDGGELGYISIVEILANGGGLDFYFTPKTLKEIRKS
jgi:hypothetical protein